MSNENPMVHIDRLKKPYYDKYSPSSGEKYFERQIDLFLFAAAYGYAIGRQVELPKPKDTESPFRWSNLNPIDITLVQAISIASAMASNEANDREKMMTIAEIIADKEKMMKIIEKYAQGGIDELIVRIEHPGEKDMNILDILKEIYNEYESLSKNYIILNELTESESISKPNSSPQ